MEFLSDATETFQPKLPEPSQNCSPSAQCPLRARLLSNERVTSASHWQDVRYLRFDIAGSGMRWAIMQHFCYYRDTICHTYSTYVTKTVRKVCTCMFKRPGLGDARQSGEMATMLNSLFCFCLITVSNIMLYLKVVKWCKM